MKEAPIKTTEAKASDKDATLTKIPLATYALGAVNIIGGAALARGWLIDIGMRFYDGISEAYEIPKGIFVPNDSRILQAGYGRFLNVVALHYYNIIAPVAASIVILAYVLFVSRFKPKGVVNRFNIFALGFLALIFFPTAYMAMFEAPKFAGFYGRNIGCAALNEVNQPSCANCRLFGEKKVLGLGVFADDKSIFVLQHGGGITRMPTSELKITPQTREVPVKTSDGQALPLTKSCDNHIKNRENHPNWTNTSPQP